MHRLRAPAHSSTRTTRALLAVVAVVLLATVAACGDESNDSAAPTTARPDVTNELASEAYDDAYMTTAVPDDQAGAQLGWFLDAARHLPIPDDAIEAHFAASVLAVVPPDQVNALTAELGDMSSMKVLGVLNTSPTALDVALGVGDDGARSVLAITIDADGKIAGLLLRPHPLRPRRDRGLRALALPKPTGPNQVGTDTMTATDLGIVTMAVNDPARAGRRVPVQLWYPAEPDTGEGRAPYALPATAGGLAQQLAVPLDDITDIRTHATVSPLPVRGSDPLRVVIFSPGFGLTRTSYTGYAAELASHGYLVAVLDHPGDGLLVELPDGTTFPADPPSPNGFDPVAAMRARIADAHAALKLLAVHNNVPGGRFEHRMDLDHIAFVGHSLGAATATQAMLEDPTFSVGANLDGSMAGDVVDKGLDRPFLLLGSEGDDDESWTTFRQHTPRALWVTIDGTQHMAFSDLPALSTLRPPSENDEQMRIGTLEPDRSAAIQRAYLVAFLDHEMHGRSEPLLDGPSRDFPEVHFK